MAEGRACAGADVTLKRNDKRPVCDGGAEVFATRVNLPAMTTPDRSYLRSSLSEMAEQIREELSAAVGEAIGYIFAKPLKPLDLISMG